MTIFTTTVTGATDVAQTTDSWLSEYRAMLRNPAPGMLEMLQLLGQAAEIFHDTATAWSAMFPLPQRIRDAGGAYPYTAGDGGSYWTRAPGGIINGPLSPPDDPGQGGLAVPRQSPGDDTDG